MAFGDCLKKKLKDGDFLKCSDKKNDKNAFWIILRNSAVEDLKQCCPQKIDSDVATRIYYHILVDNLDCLPHFICDILPSNNQERFRVVNRNLFSSNAFHPDGLANQKGVYAIKNNNEKRKGEKIVFQWMEDKNDY